MTFRHRTDALRGRRIPGRGGSRSGSRVGDRERTRQTFVRSFAFLFSVRAGGNKPADIFGPVFVCVRNLSLWG